MTTAPDNHDAMNVWTSGKRFFNVPFQWNDLAAPQTFIGGNEYLAVRVQNTITQRLG